MITGLLTRGVSRGGEKYLVMIGPFPPPVHGMAMINAAVREILRSSDRDPRVINLAAPSLKRSVAARLGRLPRVLRGMACLAATRGVYGGTLYMSVSGGLGQLYEIAFVSLARVRGMRIFLHHHSFAYLSNPRFLTHILTRVAGNSAVHICQSPRMAGLLKEIYRAGGVVPVSNIVFLVGDRELKARVRSRLQTVGFINNIAEEKGVFEFLDLVAAARGAGLPLRARLAGPFQDAQTERRVRERLADLPEVGYAGPVYGAEKEVFFSGIDALIFPTRYVNEAEPIVVHEAMGRGIPVIAYGRGCIPEVVGPGCGLVVDPARPFVPAALAQLEAWLADPASFEEASRAAARRFGETYEQNLRRWQVLLDDLVGGSRDQKPSAGMKRRA